MGFSKAWRDDILNWVRGTTFPTVPATLYVALLTTNPTDETGTGLVEVSTANWTNYARQSIASSTVGWNAPTTVAPNEQITNALKVDYGTAATTGNQTVTGFALYDAATAGVFWGWGAFSPSVVVQNGDPTYWSAGNLKLQS